MKNDRDAERYLELMTAVEGYWEVPGFAFNLTPLNGKQTFLENWPLRRTGKDALLNMLQNDPRRNIALITGQRSGWVVLDFDRSKVDGPILNRIRAGDTIPGIGNTNTTYYDTWSGGLHLLYRHDGPLRSRVLKIAGVGEAEVLADGHHATIPPSMHPVTKRKRLFVRKPEQALKLSDQEIFKRMEEASDTELPSTPLIEVVRGQTRMSCIVQLLDRHLVEGERVVGLHLLYQLLFRDRRGCVAEQVVRQKNELLGELALNDRELATQVLVNNVYNYSCLGVRGKLPYVICNGCGRLNTSLRRTLDSRKVLKLIRTRKAWGLPLATYIAFRSGEVKNVGEAYKYLGCTRQGVEKAISTLKRLGCEATRAEDAPPRAKTDLQPQLAPANSVTPLKKAS